MVPLFCSKSPFTNLWHSKTWGWNLLGIGDPQTPEIPFPTTPSGSSTAFITRIRSTSLWVLFPWRMVEFQIMRNSSLQIPRTWMAMLSEWCLHFFTNAVSERSSHVWCLEWIQELRWPTWLLSDHLGDGETWWQAREHYVTTLGMKSNEGPTGILLVMLTNIYWFWEHTGRSSKNFTGRNLFNCHDNPIAWMYLSPMLLMGRLRHRQVIHLAQGHKISK